MKKSKVLSQLTKKFQNSDNVIIKFIYKNENDKDVHVVVDANYGHQIEYNDIKKVAKKNNISYINEGIGSDIMEIIKQRKQKRCQRIH